MSNVIDQNDYNFAPREQFIAYCDILGYGSHVKDRTSAIVLAKTIKHYIMSLKTPFGSSLKFDKHPECNIKLKVFSDNILICSENNWYTIMRSVDTLQRMLVVENIFIRGALYYGDLYFDNDFICGQGIIDAHKIESQIAIFPRIIIDNKFIVEANNKIENFVKLVIEKVLDNNPNLEHVDDYQHISELMLKDLKNLTKIDFDGNYFMNYLKTVYLTSLDKNEPDCKNSYIKNYLSKHRDIINKNIIWNNSDRKILQKYNWCKQYHNTFCRQYNFVDLIIEE